MTGLYLAIILTLDIHVPAKSPTVTPVALECEHLQNPLGIDATHPRLSWQIQPGTKGEKQMAYSLTVSTDSTGQHIQWQVHKVSATQLVVYAGRPLHPYTRYYWKVSIKDANCRTATSLMANFETGPMRMSDWKGDWITDKKDINLKPASWFRKGFSLQKKIVSARAYIAAGGLYELYINGQKIGDRVLDPAYTRFDRRNLYVTYDVTRQLQRGENAIGVLLGNGWYNFQPIATWFFDKAPWRARPCFCLDLRITYSNGGTETISTARDWKRALSPVVYNSIYTGEYDDATRDSIGWNNVGYNDQQWKYVTVVHAPSEHIVSESMYPIKDVVQLPTVSVKKFNDSDYVFDIGRNIAGVSQIALKGERGTVINLKYGGRLDSAGHVDQSNIDYFLDSIGERFQMDKYTLRGEGGEETFKARFSYKGFRYVEVSSNKAVKLSKENISAWFEHSDVPVAGTINCSNDLINKIWRATNNSYLSNLFGYPTDCPQREKNGWTGDAHFAIETGLYNFDAITIYEKWLADIRDAQQPNGTLPAIVPTSDWGYSHHNTIDWESGLILIPWELYRFYGDGRALEDNYATMCRYISQVTANNPDQIISEGLGDRGAITYNPDISLTSTAYYYADVTILAKTAKLFNLQNIASSLRK
jgi:alpha-L-rhamnosidase